MKYNAEFIIQLGTLIMAILMLVGGGWLIYRRSKGFGPFTVQAFGLVLLVPTILVLAANGILSKDIVATLLGGVAGYIFGRSGVNSGSDK